MSIDFFIAKCQTENIVDKEFGICDDEDEEKKTPAYVDRNQPDKWVAVVKNQTNQSINFTAVDNCVEMNRSDGTMDFRCDAMLTNDDNIVFVELKVQAADWIFHAVDEQLQTTMIISRLTTIYRDINISVHLYVIKGILTLGSAIRTR